jgi:carbonic anhydrase/acetyltransferase-like protein (isoleucine patch superfamily)
MIAPFGERHPLIDPSAWIAPSAVIVGDVAIGAEASVWFGAVVRGDVERIRIGARSNVQDHATIHVTTDRYGTVVGADVTVGHAAVLHGCTIDDQCLIGIGAIVLDGAHIGEQSLVGAGAVVTARTEIPARSLVLGTPARPVRPLTDDEIAGLAASAARYVAHAQRYRTQGLG